MMDLIRLGDATDHGGKVISASPDMVFDGKAVARKGDKVSCPKHPGSQTIVQGDDAFTDNGLPIARNGHAVSCGCKLITSKSHLISTYCWRRDREGEAGMLSPRIPR